MTYKITQDGMCRHYFKDINNEEIIKEYHSRTPPPEEPVQELGESYWVFGQRHYKWHWEEMPVYLNEFRSHYFRPCIIVEFEYQEEHLCKDCLKEMLEALGE